LSFGKTVVTRRKMSSRKAMSAMDEDLILLLTFDFFWSSTAMF
jgi:hypothetical protein